MLGDARNHVRNEAESQLSQLSSEPRFTAAIFEIVRTSAQTGGKQSWDMALTACSFLHVNLKQFYTSRSGTVIPDEDKAFLCNNIFELITVSQPDSRVHKTALCILHLMVSADQNQEMPFQSSAWRSNLTQVVCEALEAARTASELLGRLAATLTIVGLSHPGPSLRRCCRLSSRRLLGTYRALLVRTPRWTDQQSQG